MNEISNFFLIIVYADFIILFKVKSSFQSSAKTQIPPHSLHRKHLNDLSIMDALCIELSPSQYGSLEMFTESFFSFFIISKISSNSHRHCVTCADDEILF